MVILSYIVRVVLMTTSLLLALPCSAQEQGGGLRLQFMTFPTVLEPLEVELRLADGSTVPLKVPSNEFSETIRVPAMASFAFGKTVMDETTGKPVFKIYGQGKPVAAPKQLVLLLRKGAAMADGFEVRAISSDINEFGGGKLLFVNATKVGIAGKTGNKPFTLQPGAHGIIKPKLEANGRLTHVELFYAYEGQVVPFFSTMWPVANHYRGLVFIYHDPNNANKILLHSFREFLQDNG